MRRRPCLVAFWLVGAIVVGEGTPSRAQEPECEPITAQTLHAISDRLGLADTLRAWLLDAHRRGRLRTEPDLDPAPGLSGPDREALASGLCWGSGTQGEVTVTGRHAGAGPRGELRVHTGAGRWWVGFRHRRDAEVAISRGGFGHSGHGWGMAAGVIRARRGMGLLLATAAAVPRDAAPAPARTGWGVTQALGAERLGGAIHLTRPGWGLAVAATACREPDDDCLPLQTAEWRWRGDPAEAGLLLVRDGTRWGGALLAGGQRAPVRWGTEVALMGGGLGSGLSGVVRTGAWRVEAAGTFRSASFAPVGETGTEPGESMALRLGVSRRAGSRLLRVRWEWIRDHDPRAAWPRHRDVLELEVHERLGVGWLFEGLWRHRRNGTAGAATSADAASEVLRGTLRWERRGWRVRGRLERRGAPEGTSHAVGLRAGRSGPWSWEVRWTGVTERGRGDPVFWYRRRAGDAYGWDALPAGSWLGGWARLSRGWAVWELSVDRQGDRWDLGVSLRVAWGSA